MFIVKHSREKPLQPWSVKTGKKTEYFGRVIATHVVFREAVEKDPFCGSDCVVEAECRHVSASNPLGYYSWWQRVASFFGRGKILAAHDAFCAAREGTEVLMFSRHSCSFLALDGRQVTGCEMLRLDSAGEIRAKGLVFAT